MIIIANFMKYAYLKLGTTDVHNFFQVSDFIAKCENHFAKIFNREYWK